MMSQPSITEITKKGDAIYTELKNKLERNYSGMYVVIDVDSGDYFVENDLLTAIQKAEEKYPDKLFYSARIGSIESLFQNYLSRDAKWLF